MSSIKPHRKGAQVSAWIETTINRRPQVTFFCMMHPAFRLPFEMSYHGGKIRRR
jgi:hypothetical protein